jgi:hypothetical protein
MTVLDLLLGRDVGLRMILVSASIIAPASYRPSKLVSKKHVHF